MSRTNIRIVVAAALAALSVPAFASDAEVCSVCGDPTFPAVEKHAPALVLHAQGGEAEALVRVDPTVPATGNAAPAMALTPYASSAPLLDPAPVSAQAPTVHYAIELSPSKTERVATVP